MVTSDNNIVIKVVIQSHKCRRIDVCVCVLVGHETPFLLEVLVVSGDGIEGT